MATLAEMVSQELTTDLEWREAELAVMRKYIHSSDRGSTVEAAMLRAGVAMLYAHYEGFSKFALAAYIDVLSKLKLKRKDLIWTLAALSLKGFHAELLTQNSSESFFSVLLSDLNKHLDAEAEYEKLPQISNLWPDLLIGWLTKLGLSSQNALDNRALLESLVHNRNQIAHGKKLIIKTPEEFHQYSKAALVAIHEIAVEIVTSLQNQSYKRAALLETTINHAA